MGSSEFPGSKQQGFWDTWSSLFMLAACGATIPFTPSNSKLIQRLINEHFGAPSKKAEEQVFDNLKALLYSLLLSSILVATSVWIMFSTMGHARPEGPFSTLGTILFFIQVPLVWYLLFVIFWFHRRRREDLYRR
jgi:hypothetical protein